MRKTQCKVKISFSFTFVSFSKEGFFSGHGTASASYRPEFLDHFDKKADNEETDRGSNDQVAAQASSPEAASAAGQMLQKQLQQIAGGQPVLQNVAAASAAASSNTNNPSKFQQCIAEGDLDFVSGITCFCIGLILLNLHFSFHS